MKAVIAGGGTGGHAYPAVALAEELVRRGTEVLLVGTPGGPESRLAAECGFPVETVDVIGLERKLSARSAVALAKLAAATGRSLAILGRHAPDVVVGTGGYVSLPVALAAWTHRIPLVLHEQNALPGLANRMAGRLARAVAVSFPGSGERFGQKARLTGNPVRPAIASLNRRAVRPGAMGHFGLDAGRRTLLVFGGSQGSRRINEIVLEAYDRWRGDARLQVLHLAGPRGLEDVERRLGAQRGGGDRLRWRAIAYTERMDLAYAAADLAVCRAGATTAAELAAAGVAAVLVPYPYAADDHQRLNAEALAAAGGAEMILERDLDPAALAGMVGALMGDAERLGRMSAAMRSLARPDAAERLADLVQEAAGIAPDGGGPEGRGGRPGGTPGAGGEAGIGPAGMGVPDEPPAGGGVPDEPPAGGEPVAGAAARSGGAPAGSLLGIEEGAAVWRRIHLVGLGGAGMSALARVLTEAGVAVSGSDLRESPALAALRELGVLAHAGHRASHVAGADAVIASAAVPHGNPELAAARAAGVPVLSRAEALARLVRGRRTIAVSGTHGKTTTSGMIATILEEAGLAPTWVIGADLAGRGPGGRLGSGGLAVVEADEAFGSFLLLEPAVAVVTGVDADHLDHYGTMEALEAAFERFVRRATERAVLCLDHPRAAALAPASPSAVTYGLAGDAEVRAANVQGSPRGSRFDLRLSGRSVPATLRVPGRHNVQNALAAAAACAAVGVEAAAIVRGLAAFRGVSRRFEHRGTIAGADLVDDYAHHPAEIEATLEAARWGPWSRIVAVFQPHLYSRTRALWREFGAALAGADVVVVTDVYGAREDPVPGVTGKLIVDAVCEAAPGRRVAYLPGLDEAAGFVRSQVRSGDLVVSMGAGDVTTLPDRILGWAGSGR